jgi:hypothetical protein
MLLRNYARNKRRSWRNTPDEAFFDATILMQGPLAFIVVTPLTMAYHILSVTVLPWLAQPAFDKVTNGGAIVAVISIVIFGAFDRWFKRYESILGVEAPFDSEKDRLWANIFFVGTLGMIVVFGFVSHFINQALPAAGWREQFRLWSASWSTV